MHHRSLPPSSSFPSTCPRFLDTFRYQPPRSTWNLTLLRKFHPSFFLFSFSFFFFNGDFNGIVRSDIIRRMCNNSPSLNPISKEFQNILRIRLLEESRNRNGKYSWRGRGKGAKQRFWFWSIGGIEIVASRVICLSSISTPMSILINISKYFTILIKKKKKNKSKRYPKFGKRGENNIRSRRRKGEGGEGGGEGVSEFLFLFLFFLLREKYKSSSWK